MFTEGDAVYELSKNFLDCMASPSCMRNSIPCDVTWHISKCCNFGLRLQTTVFSPTFIVSRIHDGGRISSSVSFKVPLPTNIHNAVDLIFAYANLVSELSSGTDVDCPLLYAIVCLIAVCLKYKFSRASLGQSTCLVCYIKTALKKNFKKNKNIK
jgi:hypothetical protein